MRIPFCTKGNEDLVDMVRSALALAFVPLERFKEAFKIMKKKPKGLKKEFRQFGNAFIQYLEDTWVEGNYPIEDWNFNFFKGASSNNFNEGTNRKFNNDGGLCAHPNPYKLCSWIKKLLKKADEEAFCIESDKSSKRNLNKKYEKLKLHRENLMTSLRDGDITMKKFLSTVGAHTLHLDKRVTAELAANKESSKDDNFNQTIDSEIADESSQDESLNLTQEDFSQSVDLDSSLEEGPLDKSANLINDEVFSSVHEPDTTEDTFDASALWEKRKAQQFADSVKQNVVNRNRKKSVNDVKKKKKLTLDDGWVLAQAILEENNMEVSPSQRDTPGKNNFL